jgi:hypothetical protein
LAFDLRMVRVGGGVVLMMNLVGGHATGTGSST